MILGVSQSKTRTLQYKTWGGRGNHFLSIAYSISSCFDNTEGKDEGTFIYGHFVKKKVWTHGRHALFWHETTHCSRKMPGIKVF